MTGLPAGVGSALAGLVGSVVGLGVAALWRSALALAWPLASPLAAAKRQVPWESVEM